MVGVKNAWWQKPRKDDEIAAKVKTRNPTHQHQHRGSPRWVYDGFSKTAPEYHVYRCQVKSCGLTSIHGCNQRMQLGGCSICEQYEMAHERR